MKVLTTSASAQNIDVIPRAYASSYTLKLRDTSKNKEVFSASVSASDSGNFKRLSATISPVLKEGRYYDMSLVSGSATVYKDKVFCPDQTIIKKIIITMILIMENLLLMKQQDHTITIT